MATKMEFEDALSLMKQGYKVTRQVWNDDNMYLLLEKAKDDYITLPHIDVYIPTDRDGVNAHNIVPWVATHSDLLAADWTVV